MKKLILVFACAITLKAAPTNLVTCTTNFVYLPVPTNRTVHFKADRHVYHPSAFRGAVTHTIPANENHVLRFEVNTKQTNEYRLRLLK